MFAHLTICVRDVESSAAFFESTLHWRRIHSPTNVDFPIVWLEIAPGQQIHIIHRANFQPSEFDTEFGRHFAIFQPGSSFPELKQRLAAHGARIVEAKRPTPFQRFFFRDPNGYSFEVIDQDGYVAE